ncbi:oligosaccharide flippase family protein [Yeosuana marina]|uniref:oligosaccharide flippase family protein n=1 Tax=Yeosuana marina TaxID=1565536 RepID=UPI0014243E1C|nr:oligosaccharide flippase family protein [Yeosuana marina]
MQHKSFYKIIFKNTGLYGVSQLIKILVRLFSNKIAAIFLGPLGVGIIGLLENVLGLIRGFTNFGISDSSVREIALTDQDINGLKSKRLIKIVYKWALATGVLGAIVALVFVKQINEVVFESKAHYLWVISLSFYFVFTSIASIKIAVLQAKKRAVSIVKYNISVAILSSIIAALGYYFYGINAIIPVVILTAMGAFLLSLYFTRNIKVAINTITIKQAYIEGLPMAKLGLLLSASVVFGQLCFYSIRWFLIKYYSYEILGVYQVSNTILVGYLGLIFAAMTNDFYPRLCDYENDQKSFNNLVNDQTELALLLVVPAVLVLYLIAPFLVTFLYTKEFLSVLHILKIGLIAIIFKAIVWPLGFITLIKGNKLLFLKQNLLGDGINVIASILLFHYFGLIGLGMAMVTMFIVSGIYNYYLVNKYYKFKFRKETLRTIVFSLFIGSLVVIIVLSTTFKNFNIYIIIVTLLSIIYSLFQLKNKLRF